MRFTLNGQIHDIAPDRADEPLLFLLREHFGLTGAKSGCGVGICRACTIIVGEAATRACMIRSADVAGLSVRSIEGLADGKRLHPVQHAWPDLLFPPCDRCADRSCRNPSLQGKGTCPRSDGRHRRFCRQGPFRTLVQPRHRRYPKQLSRRLRPRQSLTSVPIPDHQSGQAERQGLDSKMGAERGVSQAPGCCTPMQPNMENQTIAGPSLRTGSGPPELAATIARCSHVQCVQTCRRSGAKLSA